MRLRLLVPRGGRGRGLGGLAAVAAAAGLALVAFGGGGGEDEAARDDVRPAPSASATPEPLPAVGGEAPRRRERRKARERARQARAAGNGELAIGITEPNPHLVWGDRPTPSPFEFWRVVLGTMHPAYYRLVIDWPSVQPRARRPADMAALNGGCMRAIAPCAEYGGIRDQLSALASRQREGGWEALVVVTGTPDWAGEARAGCDEGSAGARSRPLSARGLAAYRRLVRAVLATAAEQGADLRWWSPWNEPNHPYFLSPQRTACDPGAASASIDPYVEIARALRAALAEAPGDQRYVIGELAGLHMRSPKSTTIREFIAGLPRDLVCGTPVWSQHGYLEGRDQLDDVFAELAAKDCGRRHVAWMTETGAGLARSGRGRGGNEARSCRAMHAQLRRWYRDPRVDTAFQYTLREDDQFPTGLVTVDLRHAYPVLSVWDAWGMTRRPAANARPPRQPCPS